MRSALHPMSSLATPIETRGNGTYRGPVDESVGVDDESIEVALSPARPLRVVVDNVTPALDGGRVPVKRIVGDILVIAADLLVDGHDKVGGRVLFRRPGQPDWRDAELTPAPRGNDQWCGRVTLDMIGRWHFTVEGWIDAFATWAWGLRRKVDAGQDVELELRDGARLCAAAAARARASLGRPEDTERLEAAAQALAEGDARERAATALDPQLASVVARYPDLDRASRYNRVLEVIVDVPRARFSAWYELFPRSWGPPGRHGTFRDVAERLPYVARMGFDVLYLPPIHPIGRSHRKGPNNTLQAGPDDPGSPWAIGAEEGGHKAVHPALGTLEDFRHLVERARTLGVEVALDIAFQASPDHPYVKEHPEWFVHRADGTIQYAENPPKKYQDVYPFDFTCSDWRALWAELRSVFAFWAEQGVRIFRVDNPHTKPLPFWRWCLESLKAEYPDLIFLAEAFTRPKIMESLAKAGFSQSYTYFTWRTTKADLTEYFTYLTTGDRPEFFRPNPWPNTPDILPEHLQFGTRGTFITRVVLAGTLSGTYGIYGPAFELMEKTAREGVEEYVDNEKYQLRTWDLQRSDSLALVIRRLNEIRRALPALQGNDNLKFHRTDNEAVICYSKRSLDNRSVVLVVVNLDPHNRHSAWLDLDLGALGVTVDEPFQVHDQLSDARYLWRGSHNYVALDPAVMPAHIFAVRHRLRNERTFEYFT